MSYFERRIVKKFTKFVPLTAFRYPILTFCTSSCDLISQFLVNSRCKLLQRVLDYIRITYYKKISASNIFFDKIKHKKICICMISLSRPWAIETTRQMVSQGLRIFYKKQYVFNPRQHGHVFCVFRRQIIIYTGHRSTLSLWLN